ncbi:Heat-labile A chain [Cordyceps militaris]|uniref:Heat-labile A chain n=1 Tax=Cordyceps militaris TaxID=73501 RepID=A0A2H4SQL4_CORMI|nr:Heat-labile A chain [Cordyceps militaris]
MASENECDRARTLLAQMPKSPNADNPTQVERPPTAKTPTEMTVVDICQNDPLNPPCTTVDAPYGECVTVPADYQKKISGVKPHKSSAVCRFYSKATCKGQYFEVNKGTSLVGGKAPDKTVTDLQQPPSAFNDEVASVKCGPEEPAPPPSNLRWIWSSKTQPELCARLDQLSFDFEIGDATRAGTYDRVKLDFGGAGVAPHVVADKPATSDKISGTIDMTKTFGKKTVALDSIQTIRILDQELNFQSGDGWDLKGFKLQGRCAGSGLVVYLDKFYPVDKTLQVDTAGDSSDPYSKDWVVWSGDVKIDDWATHPLCSHFKDMRVFLHLQNWNYAGTNNALYANVGQGKFLIADKPSLNQEFNATVDLQKAYKGKDVAVIKVGNIAISSEGGHDAAAPEKVTVVGECAGAEGSKATALSVKQTFSEWLYDGESFTVDITPDKWVKA